jgi:hypothetical protein
MVESWWGHVKPRVIRRSSAEIIRAQADARRNSFFINMVLDPFLG